MPRKTETVKRPFTPDNVKEALRSHFGLPQCAEISFKIGVHYEPTAGADPPDYVLEKATATWQYTGPEPEYESDVPHDPDVPPYECGCQMCLSDGPGF